MSRWLPLVLVLAWSLLATGAQAQLSGSSFGGSRGFGGSSSSSSSSSFGGGSSFGSSSNDSFERMERQRREREAAEQRRREAEEARRRAEEERRRQEELERQRQLAADRALPPAERARLTRRFGDRLQRPNREGPVPNLQHAPESALSAELPRVDAAELAWVSTHPYRSRPNWKKGGLAGAFGGWLLLGFIWVVGSVRRRRGALVARRADSSGMARPRPRGGSCEIRRVSLGFDWSERARIQRALEEMAKNYDMGSARGMHGAASEAAQLLIDALPAARYGMFQRYLESQSRAERRFFELAQDLKSRFRHDTRRGGRRQFEAKAEEGEGLVVVSFVVGATRHLGPMGSALDRQAIARLLQAAVRISPQELVALEVVWSPSAEMDRMSSLELERVYPELMPLDSASLGGVSCSYCGAVHAAELPTCPACGASR